MTSTSLLFKSFFPIKSTVVTLDHLLPASQGIPYKPYPRPGIVLDDTDFKPHKSRHRPDASVITADRLPGYGEIFDVTVSAIQGPGEKAGPGILYGILNQFIGIVFIYIVLKIVIVLPIYLFSIEMIDPLYYKLNPHRHQRKRL